MSNVFFSTRIVFNKLNLAIKFSHNYLVKLMIKFTKFSTTSAMFPIAPILVQSLISNPSMLLQSAYTYRPILPCSSALTSVSAGRS